MSKIKLEVGMRMTHPIYGNGTISTIDNSEYLPIGVTYDNGTEFGYFAEGEIFRNKLLNIPFTEGMEVECDIYGLGVVAKIHENIMCQKVQVSFSGKLDQYYTEDGRINTSANQTLFPKYNLKTT